MFDYLNYTLCYIHNGDASTQDGTLFLWGTDWTFQYYVRSLQLKITPLRRVLLLKLTCPQLVRKSPAFYRIRKLITAFTTARQVSLSWARSIQSLPLLPISSCVILILPSHISLCFPSGLFPSRFFTKLCTRLFSPPYVLHDPLISFLLIWSPN